MATKKRTNELGAKKMTYELVRENTIKRNIEKLTALGLPSYMANPLMGNEQSRSTIEKGKKTGVGDDESDYRPSESDVDSADESSDSFEHEVLNV